MPAQLSELESSSGSNCLALSTLWQVLTSVAEYGSNYIAMLQLARRTGVRIEVIPETTDGDIDIEALRAKLASGKPPVLVAITHVPTSSGGPPSATNPDCLLSPDCLH